MGRRIGVGVHLVTFKRFRKQDGPLTFSRGGAFDAYDHVHRYLEERKEMKVIPMGGTADAPAESHAMLVQKIERHPGTQVLEGLVETGESGFRSTLRDLMTSRVAHERAVGEADMPPFYFRFFFPDGQTKGLLLVQRLGRQSPRACLYVDLRRWFHTLDITCDLRPVQELFIFEKFLQGGTLNEVTLRALRRPTENRDILRNTRLGGAHLQEGTELRVTIRPTTARHDLMNRLERVVRREAALNTLVSIRGLQEVDEAIVEVEREGLGKRKFSISRPDEAGMTEDVTDKVRVENGHPTWDTIRREARRVMDELAEKLYVGA